MPSYMQRKGSNAVLEDSKRLINIVIGSNMMNRMQTVQGSYIRSD